MIIGTGIDIVELSRIKSAYDRWGAQFAERILASDEFDILKKRKEVYSYLGSRFAAKEAFLKALGTGYADGISWQDIKIERVEGERPSIKVAGRAREIMDQIGAINIHLSISHEKKYAVAQVILEG
ncbi:holo-ACP synthase [Candidatus Pacearchaeota archaeon]|nr:holo-ACP synthase [Candidatus Pacearchaeota archaeon]